MFPIHVDLNSCVNFNLIQWCSYTGSIYLASPNYVDSDAVTQILAFDLNATATAESPIAFRSTGTVPGYVLNQFSMDEFDHHFRIATTVPRTWGQDEESEQVCSSS